MREIKFRAWESLNKKMHLMNLALTDNHGNFATKESVVGAYRTMNLDSLIVMQYTGLKDKNGKEIYEGDIIRILYSDWASQSDYSITLEQHKINKSVIGTVIFEEGKYILDFGDYTDTLHHGTHGERTVIGNIYENPELLSTPSVGEVE